MPLTDDFMLPRRVRTMEQMADLLQAEEAEISQAKRTIDAMAAQLTVGTSTFLLPRHERIFGLTTNTAESLEVRRARVLARLNARGVTTAQAIRELVQIITGREGEVAEHFSDYAFSVTARLLFQDSTDSLAELIRQIDEIKPAHLVFDTIAAVEPVVLENPNRLWLQSLLVRGRFPANSQALSLAAGRIGFSQANAQSAAVRELALRVRQQEREALSLGGLFIRAKEQNLQPLGAQKIAMRIGVVNRESNQVRLTQSNTGWRFNGRQKFNGAKKFNGGIKRSEL